MNNVIKHRVCKKCVAQVSNNPEEVKCWLSQGVYNTEQLRQHPELINDDTVRILQAMKSSDFNKVHYDTAKLKEIITQDFKYPLYFVNIKFIETIDNNVWPYLDQPVCISIDYKNNADEPLQHFELLDYDNLDKIMKAYASIPQDASIFFHSCSFVSFYSNILARHNEEYSTLKNLNTNIRRLSIFMKSGAVSSNKLCEEVQSVELLAQVVLDEENFYDPNLSLGNSSVSYNVEQAIKHCSKEERQVILKYLVLDDCKKASAQLAKLCQRLIEVSAQ